MKNAKFAISRTVFQKIIGLVQLLTNELKVFCTGVNSLELAFSKTLIVFLDLDLIMLCA